MVRGYRPGMLSTDLIAGHGMGGCLHVLHSEGEGEVTSRSGGGKRTYGIGQNTVLHQRTGVHQSNEREVHTTWLHT